MDNQASVLHYKTSMAIFKKWYADGIISREELAQIDEIIAVKHGLSLCSIHRVIDLMLQEK